jgi:hypothetical protein
MVIQGKGEHEKSDASRAIALVLMDINMGSYTRVAAASHAATLG